MDKTLQDHDLEWLLLDSAVIAPTSMLRRKKGATDQGPEQEALGPSRASFSTKIHVSVSGLGLPAEIRLTPGQ